MKDMTGADWVSSSYVPKPSARISESFLVASNCTTPTDQIVVVEHVNPAMISLFLLLTNLSEKACSHRDRRVGPAKRVAPEDLAVVIEAATDQWPAGEDIEPQRSGPSVIADSLETVNRDSLIIVRSRPVVKLAQESSPSRP
jgi:hypothetical protein